MIIEFRSRKFFELQAGLALLIIGIVGIAVVWFYPAALSLVPPCLFRHWTGIPCPACGATSAGVHLSRLQIGKAVAASPLFTLLYVMMGMNAINALMGFILGKNFSLQLSWREQKRFRHLALLAVVLNWLYLVGTTLAK